MTFTPRAASRLATSSAAGPATATGPRGSGKSVTASDSISSQVSRKILPRRLLVAHHSVRAPSCGSESARASPTVTAIAGRPAATAMPWARATPRTDAGEAPRSHRYGDHVKLGGSETSVAQTIPCHDRQNGGVTALKVLSKPNDDCISRNDGGRTPGNGGIKGKDEHRSFKLSSRFQSGGSGHQAGFLERQARRPIEQAGRVTVTEINQKIRPPTIMSEKGRVDCCIVKTGHRTDVQT